MNIQELHATTKELSVKPMLSTENFKVNSIQILQGEILKKHITQTPALLICHSGEIEYGDENEQRVLLAPGDFFEIPALVPHWLTALKDSELILIK